MCFPNQSDELRRILQEADYIDCVIDALKPRSPRAGAAQRLAPSLPAAGAGIVDSQHFEFERGTKATGAGP